MNFEDMWLISKGNGGTHSDVWYVCYSFGAISMLMPWVPCRFWIVTIPVMIVVMPLFFISDIKKLYYTMKHKRDSQNAIRVSLVYSWYSICWCALYPRPISKFSKVIKDRDRRRGDRCGSKINLGFVTISIWYLILVSIVWDSGDRGDFVGHLLSNLIYSLLPASSAKCFCLAKDGYVMNQHPKNGVELFGS